MNPDTNAKQPVEDFLNGENNERAGLLVALTEAIIRFMVSLGAPVWVKNTRNLPANSFPGHTNAKGQAVDGYKVKDAVKATMLGKVARFVGIKPKTVTPFDLMRSGVHRIHLMVNGVPQVINTADRVMLEALAATNAAGQAVRRAAAAIVAFDQWQATAATEREAAIRALKERTGQDIDEVPEGCKVATEKQAAAFGLSPGDLIRYVVVESVAMLRDGFKHMAKTMENETRSMIDNSTTGHTGGDSYSTAVLTADGDRFTVNRGTFVDWFKTQVFANSWYCSPCKKAKRSALHANTQVRNAGTACPNCGNPRHSMAPQANTTHLPFLTSAEEGLATVGGHRYEMRATRFSAKAFKAGVAAVEGRMTIEDAMRTMMVDGAVKVRGKGGDFTEPARLVPVLFDIQADNGFSHHLGWAVEKLHTATGEGYATE